MVDFVANLVLRSNHLREGFVDETKTFFGGVRAAFGSAAGRLRIEETFADTELMRRGLRAGLAQHPQLGTTPLERLQLERVAVDQLPSLLAAHQPTVEDAVGLLTQVFDAIDVDEGVRRGHVQSLQGSTAMTRDRMPWLHELVWMLVPYAAGSLVLGDVGPLGRRRNGERFEPVFAVLGDVEAVVLPLAHDLALAGHRGQPPLLDAEDLLADTVASSRDFFLALHNSDREAQAGARIGSRAALLSPPARDAILSKFQENLTTTPLAPVRAPERDRGLSLHVEPDASGPTADLFRGLSARLTAIFSSMDRPPTQFVDVRVRLTNDLPSAVADEAQRLGLSPVPRVGAKRGFSLVRASDVIAQRAALVVVPAVWESIEPHDKTLVLFDVLFALSWLLLADAHVEVESFRERTEEMAVDAARHLAAAGMATLLLGGWVQITTREGEPIAVGDAIVPTFLEHVRVGLASLDRRRAAIDRGERGAGCAIAWAVRDEVVHVLAVLFMTLGMTNIDAVRAGLGDDSLFDKFLAAHWFVLAANLTEDTSENVTRVIEDIIAVVGIHVVDTLRGELVLTFPPVDGTPDVRRVNLDELTSPTSTG